MITSNSVSKFNFVVISLIYLTTNKVSAQETAASAQGGSIWLQLLPIALIFGVFFLLVILPQQRKLKKHRNMVSALKKGDEVITSAGIFGKVQKINEDQTSIMLEISDKTSIRISRDSVAQVINLVEPAKEKPKS